MCSRTIVSMNFGFNFANSIHQIRDDFIFVGVDRRIHRINSEFSISVDPGSYIT